jgi:hypothetical protein
MVPVRSEQRRLEKFGRDGRATASGAALAYLE